MVCLLYSLFPLVITVVKGYNDFSGTQGTDTDRGEVRLHTLASSVYLKVD